MQYLKFMECILNLKAQNLNQKAPNFNYDGGSFWIDDWDLDNVAEHNISIFNLSYKKVAEYFRLPRSRNHLVNI